MNEIFIQDNSYAPFNKIILTKKSDRVLFNGLERGQLFCYRFFHISFIVIQVRFFLFSEFFPIFGKNHLVTRPVHLNEF